MIIVVFLLCLLQQVPAFLPPLSSQKTHATPSPSPASYSRINDKYKSAYSSSINLISKTLLRAGREAMQEEDDFEVDEEELVRRLNEEIQRESGVELEQLINPSKVVNLERELIKLRRGLQTQSLSVGEREKMEKKVTEKQNKLNIEKRAVMRGWLKNLFVTQSVIAGVLSLGMVYDLYPNTHLPLSVQVLGFWMWWLFIIPSLR